MTAKMLPPNRMTDASKSIKMEGAEGNMDIVVTYLIDIGMDNVVTDLTDLGRYQ
jgi:hypothetical protein